MGKDKWHNRLHLVTLENGIIGHVEEPTFGVICRP